jgi:hypothetical protein
VRGVLITPLNEDGSKLYPAPEKHWIDTAQEVSVEAEVVEGESGELRGGDRILVRIEEDDIVVGAELGFTDARFDAKATELIAGGTLIYDGNDPDVIIGWDSPKIEEQYSKKPFEAEVFVQAFNAEGGREAYLRYTFRYCKGSAPSITHGDQEWGTPEFTLKARENPSTKESTYKKEFVSVLPLVGAPTDLVATPGVKQVALTWSAVDGADSYSVFFYKGGDAPVDPNDWEEAVKAHEETSYIVTELDGDTEYVFTVIAINEAGETGMSDIVEATPTAE